MSIYNVYYIIIYRYNIIYYCYAGQKNGWYYYFFTTVGENSLASRDSRLYLPIRFSENPYNIAYRRVMTEKYCACVDMLYIYNNNIYLRTTKTSV